MLEELRTPTAIGYSARRGNLDPLVVNRDDIVQRTRCSLGHGGSFSLTWLRLATSSSARFGAAQPYLIVRKILYVIMALAWVHAQAPASEMLAMRLLGQARALLANGFRGKVQLGRCRPTCIEVVRLEVCP